MLLTVGKNMKGYAVNVLKAIPLFRFGFCPGI